jgi:hypothetical protein
MALRIEKGVMRVRGEEAKRLTAIMNEPRSTKIVRSEIRRDYVAKKRQESGISLKG